MTRPRCGHRLWLAIVSASLAGCATSPPQVSPPEAGEGSRQIARRHEDLNTKYRFWLEGHTYGLASTRVQATTWWLVLIDDSLACRLESGELDRAHHEVLQLQWLGEPDGLPYLADRLRQACGLAAPTAPRPIPPDEPTFPASDPPALSPAPGPGSHDDPGSGQPAPSPGSVDDAAMTALGVIAGLVLLPVAIPLVGIAEVIESSGPQHAFQFTEQRQALIGLPVPVGKLRDKVGPPELQFRLPRSGTEVWTYGPGNAAATLFVGIAGGQAVWVAKYDEWLVNQATASRDAAP